MRAALRWIAIALLVAVGAAVQVEAFLDMHAGARWQRLSEGY